MRPKLHLGIWEQTPQYRLSLQRVSKESQQYVTVFQNFTKETTLFCTQISYKNHTEVEQKVIIHIKSDATDCKHEMPEGQRP